MPSTTTPILTVAPPRRPRGLPRLLAAGAMTVACALAPSVATAQDADSRAAAIIAEQAKKASALEAEKPTTFEKLIVKATSARRLAYPWFGSVYHGSGPAAGLGITFREAGNGSLTLIGGATLEKSTLASVTWFTPRPSTRVIPHIVAQDIRAKGQGFYGVGADTETRNRREYEFRKREATAGLDLVVAPGLTVTGSYGYLGVSTIGASPRFEIGDRVDFGVATVQGKFDWRPAEGYSRRGGMLRAAWSRYGAMDDAPFTFSRSEFEAVQLIPVFSEQFVLAGRFLATTTGTDEGNSVPFPLLPEIGSGHTVRGYTTNRFQDRSRMLLSAEYRWMPSRVIDMALFFDRGGVGPTLGDIARADLRNSWGIGVRFHAPATTLLRIEAARSSEGWRPIVAFSRSF